MKRHMYMVLYASFLLMLLFFTGGSEDVYAVPARSNPYYHLDPYQTGCNNGAYVAISEDITDQYNRTFATLENWYSPRCNTNWALIWWTGGFSTYTQIYAKGAAFLDVQCYSENCRNWYTSGLSPSWTGMVDGSGLACIHGAVMIPTLNGQIFQEPEICA